MTTETVRPGPGSAESSGVVVVGAGYVGLTTAVCLAHLGHRVGCLDIDSTKIEQLRQGRPTILERDLDHLLSEGLEANRLRFSTDPAEVMPGTEFVFLCVPTPQASDGSADLSYLKAAASEIGPLLDAGAIVVNKSTVPVGSTRVVERALGRRDVSVVSNPEFLREGSSISDFLHPDRIVIGSECSEPALRLSRLFSALEAPVLLTDPATAETIKYAANAFLATKVSFVNAIANLCEAVGANVTEVAVGMGYDRRIGMDFLQPGPGWGGSCFPKDTRALVHIAEDAGYDFSLLKGVIAVNDEQYERVIMKVVRQAGGSLNGANVAIWGLTFKADTDDLRDSPAIEIARRIVARGGTVHAYDPTVSDDVPGLAITVSADPYSACERADVLVVATEWREFGALDFAKVGASMTRRSIVDTRNLLDAASLRSLGFSYEGMGVRLPRLP